MRTTRRPGATPSSHRRAHALANGRWSLPEGYGVMVESYTPARAPAVAERRGLRRRRRRSE